MTEPPLIGHNGPCTRQVAGKVRYSCLGDSLRTHGSNKREGGRVRTAHIAALIAICALATMMALPSSAQDAATPEGATPAAVTPAALSPEEARAGRLGGSLGQILDAYGQPDWTDEGLVGYNTIVLGGIGTITMVYFDEQERVRSYLLVYLEAPEAFDEHQAIADVVADVTPRDGICDSEPLDESGLGDRVYACESAALEGVFSTADLLDFGVFGEDGTYNFAVDPTDDDFYEIAIRLGVDTPPVPPTPVPLPTPTPRPPLTDTFPLVPDIFSLINGDFESGQPVSFSGTVIDVLPDEQGTLLPVLVVAVDGSGVTVDVVNQDDLVGIFPGTLISVYGIYTGVDCASGACIPTVYAMELRV
ncbi:hypothetical protein BH23CHL5_BH23CHL5_25510 [soil metagenome]